MQYTITLNPRQLWSGNKLSLTFRGYIDNLRTMSTNETPESLDFSQVPLRDLLLSEDEAMKGGIVMDAEDVHKLYQEVLHPDSSGRLILLQEWPERIVKATQMELSILILFLVTVLEEV